MGVAKQVGECLDGWKESRETGRGGGGRGGTVGGGGRGGGKETRGEVGTLQYKTSRFEVTITDPERPYHDVCTISQPSLFFPPFLFSFQLFFFFISFLVSSLPLSPSYYFLSFYFFLSH